MGRDNNMHETSSFTTSFSTSGGSEMHPVGNTGPGRDSVFDAFESAFQGKPQMQSFQDERFSRRERSNFAA